MVWNVNSPDGAKSVKQNTIPMQQNTAYLLSTQQKDHFFNEGSDEDGHHKWAQMVATNDANKSLQTNMTLAAGIDASYFTRFMTPGETNSVGTEANTQPFFVSQNSTIPNESIMQLLGIRACAVFNVVGGVVTVVYKFNMTSVARTAQGKYTATYTNSLPSNAYMVLGGAIYNGGISNILSLNVIGGTDLVNNKNVSQCLLRITTETNTTADPLQAWFICFGG